MNMAATATGLELPRFALDGEKLEKERYVAPGTGFAKLIGFIIAFFGSLLLIVVSQGVFLIVLLISPILAHIANRKGMAMIRGNGVRIDEQQLPTIHAAVETLARRSGLDSTPEIYLVQENVINAFAVRFGKRNVILLTDDMIEACMRCPRPEALGFILAHEVAHVAHGHLGFFRAAVSRAYKKLMRLDEFSADALATALIKDKQLAATGIALLAAGPALVGKLDFAALVRQAEEVEQDKYSKKAEKKQTHPLLLRRLLKVLA